VATGHESTEHAHDAWAEKETLQKFRAKKQPLDQYKRTVSLHAVLTGLDARTGKYWSRWTTAE
jgi:hypothetical protein